MKPKNFIARASLFILSIIVVLVLLEGVFRLFNLYPRSSALKDSNIFLSDNMSLVYELKPNFHGNNSDGMYDREHYILKPVDTIRIAVLGDSVAYGVGVGYDERFSNLLEKSLNKYARENNSKNKYEILNFAIPGYNTNNEIEQLKVKVAKYKPDIIVLSYFVNDNDSLPQLLPLYYLNTRKLNHVSPQYFHFLWKIKLARFLAEKSDLFHFILARIYSIKLQQNNKHLPYQNVINGFQELKKYADSNNTRIIILFNPTLNYDEYNLLDKEAITIQRLAFKNTFMFINMCNSYSRNFKSGKELWIKNRKNIFSMKQDIAHPNALGHKCIAEELAKTITKIFN